MQTDFYLKDLYHSWIKIFLREFLIFVIILNQKLRKTYVTWSMKNSCHEIRDRLEYLEQKCLNNKISMSSFLKVFYAHAIANLYIIQKSTPNSLSPTKFERMFFWLFRRIFWKIYMMWSAFNINFDLRVFNFTNKYSPWWTFFGNVEILP